MHVACFVILKRSAMGGSSSPEVTRVGCSNTWTVRMACADLVKLIQINTLERDRTDGYDKNERSHPADLGPIYFPLVSEHTLCGTERKLDVLLAKQGGSTQFTRGKKNSP